MLRAGRLAWLSNCRSLMLPHFASSRSTLGVLAWKCQVLEIVLHFFVNSEKTSGVSEKDMSFSPRYEARIKRASDYDGGYTNSK
jgi:hypothetical protein